jgi:drug/metabolite transporter (DMT)-like permease
VLRPGGDLFQPVALLGLSAGLMSAVAQTGVRRLTQSEPIERIIFYFTAISTVVSAVPAIPVWVTPSPAAAGLLVLVGLFATMGQLFMTRAYSHAPASQVGGFIYAAVLFAAIFDWASTGAPPHPLFVVGAALIIGAGALTLRLVGWRRGSPRGR